MTQTRSWKKTMAATLLAASLAAPAAAAERSRPAQGPGGWWAEARQALAIGLAAWLGPAGRWTVTWGADGRIMDPDGLTAPTLPTPTGSSTTSSGPTSSVSTDDGRVMDPDG